MTQSHDLDPAKLAAYLALKEVSSLLQDAVEQQLKADGGLTGTQFQILAMLGDAPRNTMRMTDLADGIVHSRSGLTYQASQLEKGGLVTRGPSEDDERSTVVTLTDAGRGLLRQVLPGHVEVVQRLLLDTLDDADIVAITDIMGRVRSSMRARPPRSARRGGSGKG